MNRRFKNIFLLLVAVLFIAIAMEISSMSPFLLFSPMRRFVQVKFVQDEVPKTANRTDKSRNYMERSTLKDIVDKNSSQVEVSGTSDTTIDQSHKKKHSRHTNNYDGAVLEQSKDTSNKIAKENHSLKTKNRNKSLIYYDPSKVKTTKVPKKTNSSKITSVHKVTANELNKSKRKQVPKESLSQKTHNLKLNLNDQNKTIGMSTLYNGAFYNMVLIRNQSAIVGVKPSLCVVNPHLQKRCPKEKLQHDDTSHTEFETCRGYGCMCFKQNPTLIPYYPKKPPDLSVIMPAELKLLQEPPVRDFRALPDPKKTRTFLMSQDARVGETIKIGVKLYDGYDRPVSRGGDYLMGRIEGQGHKMDSMVSDLENGTYVFTFPAYWSGNSTVTIYLKHLRETRRLQYLWKRTLVDIYFQCGTFVEGNQHQMTLCSASPKIPGYVKICNFTKHNNNHPWYCGHPPSPTLGCHHIKSLDDMGFTNFPSTEVELKMLKLRKFVVVAKLPVKIQEARLPKENKNIPACSKLSPIDTWNRKWPIGYFKNNTWQSLHCSLKINKSDIFEYLQNTTVHLFGDSTTRQFYVILKSLTNCKQVTKDWTTSKWYEDSICVHSKKNFRLLWTPHEMPFSGCPMTNTTSFYTFSDAAALREYSNSISGGGHHRYIVVLHHYMHFRHPYRVFQHYMQHLKRVLEKLPKRKGNLEVFIKGGHHFMDHSCTTGLSDMVTEDFLDIMVQELKSCRHKVWFLDYKNMLDAAHNDHRHASADVIFEMIRMMFGYIIKK